MSITQFTQAMDSAALMTEYRIISLINQSIDQAVSELVLEMITYLIALPAVTLSTIECYRIYFKCHITCTDNTELGIYWLNHEHAMSNAHNIILNPSLDLYLKFHRCCTVWKKGSFGESYNLEDMNNLEEAPSCTWKRDSNYLRRSRRIIRAFLCVSDSTATVVRNHLS